MSALSSHTKRALILSVIILVLICGSLLWLLFSLKTMNQPVAQIYQNGKLIQSIDLSTVTVPYQFTVYGKNGSQNTIQVSYNTIGIVEASCPDKICVHQGFIRTPLLPITCLPNHLVIQIRSGKSTAAPDIITY